MKICHSGFRYLILYLLFFSSLIQSDNFNYNSYNNHGVIGLINMPSARFLDSSSHGITINYGDPDQHITFTSSPYDWLEASFFYNNIKGYPYCDYEAAFCSQDHKDKGFNFKIRLKEEGILPALAIGINDIGGTGIFSSEYIVASYGINALDIHFGLAWGALDGSKNNIKNPFSYLSDNFNNRDAFEGKGGQIQPKRYFTGETASPFFGISYALNKKTMLHLENDTTVTPGEVNYEIAKTNFSLGLNYQLNQNFSIGLAHERGNINSLRFVYKNNPNKSYKPYKYESAEVKNDSSKYTKLRKNLQKNGIGVNKIIETPSFIGLELTQFTHPNLDIIEEIIKIASAESGITKSIKKELKIADLTAISEYDQDFKRNSKLIYQRKTKRKFSTDTKLTVRPFLASREEFFKGAILLENNSEYVVKDNFFFSSNIKYSIADNFSDLIYPPVDTYPAQVRSDIKDYLRNYSDGIIIGRAQFDYHLTPKKNHHVMLSAGILEDMFSGIGLEYLFFKQKSNYAMGFELFEVVKRDYDSRLGTLEYQNITGSLNLYYRNYKILPFDAKVSYGEYLAGDKGTTFEVSRSFANGVEFGVFASFTDVTSEQFGEGSFDKGIFFNIPIYNNLFNYAWRPLTKDPGAKLNRKHTLYDLLVKFRPHNS